MGRYTHDPDLVDDIQCDGEDVHYSRKNPAKNDKYWAKAVALAVRS
jgi:hypothetical protein